MSFWDSKITGTVANDFAFMVKTMVDDGMGSTFKKWTQGATFTANVSKVNTKDQVVAEARDGIAVYKVTTHKSLILDYHDVIRRLSDGKTFRITSDGDDMATPDVSTLDMRIVLAEEWEIPAGDEIAPTPDGGGEGA
jgi:hypothetical protein